MAVGLPLLFKDAGLGAVGVLSLPFTFPYLTSTRVPLLDNCPQ